MIPDFNHEGNLPPGIHHVDEQNFFKYFGFNNHRKNLLTGLKKLILNLRGAGCGLIYLDGSFTTTKEIPNDYDACWTIQGVDIHRIDPYLLDFSNKGRLLQKTIYLGDIFPAHIIEQSCGLEFLKFFQIDKYTGKEKGIVAIKL